MSTFNRAKLSGSTSGRGIKVAATATPGTLLHTAVNSAGANVFDEVYAWASNPGTVSVTLTVEFGGVTSPDDLIVLIIPPGSGMIPILYGNCLQNNLVVRAFASAANVLTVVGHINAIT